MNQCIFNQKLTGIILIVFSCFLTDLLETRALTALGIGDTMPLFFGTKEGAVYKIMENESIS